MDFNWPHVHLMLNHFPTIGMLVVIGLLVVASAMKSDDLKRLTFGLIFLLALIALPTFMTGYGAMQNDAFASRADVAPALLETHQAAAALGLIFIELLGLVAWIGLWQYRRHAQLAPWVFPAVLALAVITLGIMGGAAAYGGEAVHPEFRTEGGLGGPAPGSLTNDSIAVLVTSYFLAWPGMETVHFIGMALVFGVVLIVNLRLLGLWKNAAFPDLHRLLPWGVAGFTINTITGMIFYVANPGRYSVNPSFHWKIFFLMLAGGSLLYLTVFDEAWNVKQGDDAPMRAKIVAGAQVVCWSGVIYFGRMIPYLGL